MAVSERYIYPAIKKTRQVAQQLNNEGGVRKLLASWAETRCSAQPYENELLDPRQGKKLGRCAIAAATTKPDFIYLLDAPMLFK